MQTISFENNYDIDKKLIEEILIEAAMINELKQLFSKKMGQHFVTPFYIL